MYNFYQWTFFECWFYHGRISQWLKSKTKCEICTKFCFDCCCNSKREDAAHFFFELQQQQKSKQINLVFWNCFLATVWFNKTNLGRKTNLRSILNTQLENQISKGLNWPGVCITIMKNKENVDVSVKLSMPTGTNFGILLGFMHYYDKKITMCNSKRSQEEPS